MSLRNKIGIFLILISIVAVFSAGLLVLQNATADKKNYVTELNSVLSPQIASSLDQKSKGLILSLGALNGLSPSGFSAALKNFKHHNSDVDLVIIKTKDNKLLSFSLSDKLPADQLNELTEKLAAFNSRLEKGRLSYSENGLFLTPFDSESFAAVLLGERFFKDAFDLGRGKPAALVSRDRKMLFRSNLNESFSPLLQKVPNDVWSRTEIISLEMKDEENREHLINISQNSVLQNTFVVFVAPQATWRELTSPILKSSLGLVALLIALSMLIAYFISKSLAKPIEELTELTSRVGKGDWNRLAVTGNGHEIRKLTKAFNRMIENLKVRERELKVAQSKIVQAESLAAVGRMGAGIAHEVKNPLSSILGYGQLIEMKISAGHIDGAPALLEKVKEYVKLLLDDTRRANKIISELLTFTRQKAVNTAKLSLQPLLQEFVPKLQSLCDAEGIHFSSALNFADAATINADAEQLYQVIFNLVQNAVHALKASSLENKAVTFTANASGTSAEITIADNGPGISEENIKKIFEPFFSTKKVGEGTGLGLAICYGIIQQHQGSIEVSSEPGQPTRFTIRLPLAD